MNLFANALGLAPFLAVLLKFLSRENVSRDRIVIIECVRAYIMRTAVRAAPRFVILRT